MGTSGSTDFLVTGTDIVKGALRALTVIATGETPEASEIADGLQALNMMIKQWMAPSNPLAPGLKIFQREEKTLTLAAKATYELQPSGGDLDVAVPVKILSAVLRNTDNQDIPLSPMTMEQYYRITGKSETGTPSGYYYERQLDTGYLYLDYIPSDTTDTIVMKILRVLEDMDAAGNNPDFTQEWFRPLKFNLAIDLAPEYGKEVTKSLRDLAQESLYLANSFHPETTDVYFQPGLDY